MQGVNTPCPIAVIEPGAGTAALRVVVPTLPVCFSAGDTLDAATTGAEETTAAWIDVASKAGEAVPMFSGLEVSRFNPDYVGWLPRVVIINAGLLLDTTEWVNIMFLPRIS